MMKTKQTRQTSVRKVFFSFFILLFAGIQNGVLAKEGKLGDEVWTVEKKIGRVFYTTHGNTVWGHEFGFYKDLSDCKTDILWLSFTSPTEKVKDFEGRDVPILLNVDGKVFEIKLPLLRVATRGVTHVMMFTNWVPGKQLMDAFKKGRNINVKILEPRELQALLDIKEDSFSLIGFTAKRKEAEAMCIVAPVV